MKIIATNLIVLISGVTAQATIDYTNSNSRIEDELKYSIFTDKYSYQLDEPVHMIYQITNLSPTEEKIVVAPHGPPWEFCIQDQEGNILEFFPEIWSPMILYIRFSPFETRTFPYTDSYPDGLIWDMTDLYGNPVEASTYVVSAGLICHPSSLSYVSVPIQIIPEPTSLVFLSLGMSKLSHF